MASFKQYTASGGASEAFSIPTFTSDEIKVRVDGVLKSPGTHYNITSYTTNGGTVTWTSGNVPSSGTVYIYRDTKILNSGNSDVEGKATYSNASPIYHGDLNNNQTQVLRSIEEENDQLIQSWDLAAGVVETDSIKDGTIVNADINASAAIAQSKLNIADASTSASGYMSGSDKTKLDGIETGATADQTNAEIRTAVEAASDSNVFTDADHSKLNAIEAGATTDQTDAEIRAAVEAATDSNVFTDADHTKLNGIAAGAEVNVQSDWDQATNTADDFIKNKPAIVELIDEDDFASDSATKSPSQQSVKAYIAATSQPKDNELTTLAGMQPGTATQLAGSTALTSSTAELNLLDGKSVVTTVSGSSTDVQLPTAKAVNDQVVNLLNDVGGFVPVANRTSFPNANPDPGNDAGTIVSIADAGGLVVNSSGVATNAATLGGTTVTINGIDSTLHSSTIANGKGMLVQTTSTLNTYTYHRLVVDEAGVASAQTLVTDFNQRYQVAANTPSNQPDGTALAEGDLWFDTGTDKMKVYSGSQYDVVTSVGDYKLLTIVNDGQTSGSPTYNGSNVSFDLRDGSNAANITSVGQLLISVNGILQKPNAGSWSASNEGFHLEGTNGIKFCTAPASGDSIFITLIGSATSVNVPATNSIVEAAIQDEQVSEQKLKVSNTGSNGHFLQKSAGTGGLTWAAAGGAASIADDSIVEAKLDIHADPSGTDKFLAYTSNGMEWAVPPDTNTQVGGATGVDFNDDVKARFGTGNDLQIYHDATNSEIKESTGNLNIICNSAQAINLKHGSENMLRAITDGAVELYHDDTKKLETTSVGMRLSGNYQANDGYHIYLGTDNDLDIYHDGGNSWVKDVGTGALYIDSNGSVIALTKGGADENMAKFYTDGAVELYYDNSKKLETTSGGVTVTGVCTATSFSGDGSSLTNLPAGGNSVELVADGAIAAGKPVQIKTNGKAEEIKESVTESNITYKTGNVNLEDTDTSQNDFAWDPTNRYLVNVWMSNESGSEYTNYRVLKANEAGTNFDQTGSDNRFVSSSVGMKHVRVVYESNRQKFLAFCITDATNSNYKTSYVGTPSESGGTTTITWSNKTTVSTSTRENSNSCLCFDSTNNEVIAVWRNYDYGLRAVAGSMNSSGEMTWGTVATIDSGANTYENIDVQYDSTTDRIVCVYRQEESNGTRTGRMRIGNITSANTITWGSETTWFNGDFNGGELCCNGGKAVIVYGDKTDNSKFRYIVGTLSNSDNTITLGTAANGPTTNSCFYFDTCFNPIINKFIVTYTKSHNTTNNVTDDWKVIKATLSGTTLTWDTANELETDSDGGRHLDIINLSGSTQTSSGAFAIVGQMANDSNKNSIRLYNVTTATSNQYEGGKRFIGFAPSAISDGATGTINTDGNTIDNQSGLTAGTRYYVQDSGALGTGTSNGSGVTLRGGGLALSATKVLIRYKHE